MNDIVYWIWLSRCCTPDTVTFPKLMTAFDGAKAVYDASLKEISEVIGYRASDRSLLDNKDLTEAESIFEYCTRMGVGLLPYCDERYPASLRDIPTPPVLLYYRGVLPDFDRSLCIAAVGTRALSDYGRKNAFSICYDLATAGATVVSGMAIGIDGVSLAGALAAERPTVAVLGCGIDICYPKQHLTLAREIVKTGCIMTEFPPHTPPSKYNFPKRNRIISGLSVATVVFEGTEKSGAIITARYAREQKREVYVLPGSVGYENSEASTILLRNGARACTSADDIVADFEKTYIGALNPHLMQRTRTVDMMETLRRYQVSALCQGDEIFVPPHTRRTHTGKRGHNELPNIPELPEEVLGAKPSAMPETVTPPDAFDKDALRLYKKIPLVGDCTVDSLVDGETPMRDVMRLLLKLEMGYFITRLPGERVARKTK